jgi:uncharacterized membrane protein
MSLLRRVCAFLIAFLIIVIQVPCALGYFEWRISNFDVSIDVFEDSSLTVKEHVVVDFDVERHGIFRDIPVEYLNDLGLNYNLRLKVVSVTDENGNPWMYETSGSGQHVRIKIGDPDVYVEGRQKYIITYNVNRGIRFFSEFDELYWNVTGNDWGVPIDSASLTVKYPHTKKDLINTTCFTGYQYSREKGCKMEYNENGATFSTKDLEAYQGLTAAISWPKETLIPPSRASEIIWFLKDNWGFALPFLAFFVLYYFWLTRGRDPKKYHTVVVEFAAPEDMTPAEMGTLLDESADLKDVSAEIVHLAVNKHVIIEEHKKKGWIFSDTDYILKKRQDKAVRKPLSDHQERIMKALFGSKKSVKVSDLKNKFYKSIPGIKKALYEEVVSGRKYFKKNPDNVRSNYFIIGAIILFFSFVMFSLFASMERLDLIFGTILTGPVFMLMARYMPRKTLAGAEAHRKTLGFRDYIHTAERYRVKCQEDQHIFERFLPYAMIFGLADKWAGAFEGIYKGKPDWYKGEGDFVPTNFVSRINNFTRAANTTLSSRPSSKGSSSSSGFSGGFSGGGFGGGGGGSW